MGLVPFILIDEKGSDGKGEYAPGPGLALSKIGGYMVV